MNFDPSLPDDEVNVSGTHPLREALVLIAGIAGVGFVLFVVIALAVEILMPWIPPSFEVRVFSSSRIVDFLGPEGSEAGMFETAMKGQLLAYVAIERSGDVWLAEREVGMR